MKIISLIQDPDVIRRILEHLGLWKQNTDFAVRNVPEGNFFEFYGEVWK